MKRYLAFIHPPYVRDMQAYTCAPTGSTSSWTSCVNW